MSFGTVVFVEVLSVDVLAGRMSCAVEYVGWLGGARARQQFMQPLSGHECPRVWSPVADRYERLLPRSGAAESAMEEHWAYMSYSEQELFIAEVCNAMEELRGAAVEEVGDSPEAQAEWLVGRKWTGMSAESFAEFEAKLVAPLEPFVMGKERPLAAWEVALELALAADRAAANQEVVG